MGEQSFRYPWPKLCVVLVLVTKDILWTPSCHCNDQHQICVMLSLRWIQGTLKKKFLHEFQCQMSKTIARNRCALFSCSKISPVMLIKVENKKRTCHLLKITCEAHGSGSNPGVLSLQPAVLPLHMEVFMHRHQKSAYGFLRRFSCHRGNVTLLLHKHRSDGCCSERHPSCLLTHPPPWCNTNAWSRISEKL